MKKLTVLILCIMMAWSFAAARAETADGTGGNQDGGKIVVLATGGTIAGVGEEGKTEGYKPGTLTAGQSRTSTLNSF